MEKRTIIFGQYNTALNGWTLTSLTLSAPEQKTEYVSKTCGDGSWDLSTVLTGGVPRYKDRTLTVTLEHSGGTRAERERIINNLVNLLDGQEWNIVLPDRPDYYLTGRLHVAVNYSDRAHAAVTITGTCSPWLYKADLTLVTLALQARPQTETLHNEGRRSVIPVLIVDGAATLTYGQYSTRLTSGQYEWPALMLHPGEHELKYSGIGSLMITYREAVLR